MSGITFSKKVSKNINYAPCFQCDYLTTGGCCLNECPYGEDSTDE